MPCLSLLAAEPPSKPFLDKNSFYLSSAGFKVHFANDAAGKKAMYALPPHRFVIHDLGGDVRYLYAESQYCMCIFIGTILGLIYQQNSGFSATPAGAGGPPPKK